MGAIDFLEIEMKQVLSRIVAIVVVSLFTLQPSAQNPNNPIQIALLRWYQANTASALALENTCISPQGVAFDGANIWVGYGQGSHLPAAGVYKL